MLSTGTGAFSVAKTGNQMPGSSTSGKGGKATFSANTSSAVYQDDANVVPNSRKTRFYIKF